MRERPAVRWREVIVGLMLCAVTLVFSAEATATESVRAELIRLQQETGLTFA